ncbi:MAG: ArsC/Spx/MgsR family protein [Paracoccaceae bacterium]
MQIFALNSCDTCRKAIRDLRRAGHIVQITDVRRDGVPATELAKFHSVFGDDLVNRRSTTWRGLSETARQRPVPKLMRAHPTLMKRPVTELDGQYYLGWGSDVREAVLG